MIQTKKKKADEIRWGRSLATTGVMILLVVAASFAVLRHINRMEEERSFERLYEEAGRLADTIELYAASDREELRMLSAVIGKYDDLYAPELWDLLDSYTAVGMMSRVELLLPGDVVLTRGGTPVDGTGTLSFDREAALGEHITDRETDILDSENYIARHYVPVLRDGETVAMLYGVIELGELPEEVNLDPYGGQGAVYIIDGLTGDFLVDTWHPGQVGNMWEMGQREMAPGYDSEQLRQGVYDGDSRYVVFVSRTAGEYLYFYYEPMAINQWRIAVSVPESVVFANADAIARVLNLFLIFELVCFMAYFLWMIRYARQVTGEKQRRLETLNFLYDVENLLFNAHEKRENLDAALEKIGGILPAEQVGFWIAGQPRAFRWRKEPAVDEPADGGDQARIHKLLTYFEAGNRDFEAYNEKALREMFPEEDWAGVRNLVAVPVGDMDGKICGILAVRNITGGPSTAALLKNLKFSFSMFCRNLKHYTELREQGDRDALTGLYNRNRYERDLRSVYAPYSGPLVCAYIDVNGLHEMNNANGHDKGDQMLAAVAAELRRHFDPEHTYRIGGDEFVVFVPGGEEDAVAARCHALAASLAAENYHVSIGVHGERCVSSLQALIKAAEKNMYEEKKRYYEQEAHDRRRTAR